MVLNKKGPTKRSRASFHTWCPYVTTMIDVEATLKQLVNRQFSATGTRADTGHTLCAIFGLGMEQCFISITLSVAQSLDKTKIVSAQLQLLAN